MTKKIRLFLGVMASVLLVALGLGVQRGEIGLNESKLAPGVSFDANRAWVDLETVVGFGPRPAGSANLEKTREYIVAELKSVFLEPILDQFIATTPLGDIEMVNIRVVIPGRREESILVGGHYDTKRFDTAFVGANDGGSSTAVLLELARISPELNLEHTLEFIFFDGEEAVVEWTAEDSVYGSRYDVDRRHDEGTLRRLKALVLVDMVGDIDLGIIKERSSTTWLKDLIWETAAKIGYSGYFRSDGYAVEDDHIPYLKAGVDAIDLIDLDYPYWHTPADTLEKNSAKSLKVVGDVVFRSLESIDRHLNLIHP